MSRRVRLILAIGLALVMTEAVRGETPPKEGGKEHTDRYGDPLPPGAIARLGTALAARRVHHEAHLLPRRQTGSLRRPQGRGFVWDSASGRQLQRFATDNYSITSLAFSPDGKLLAVAGEQAGILHVFDVLTGKEVRRFEKPLDGLQSVAFSPDGKCLAGGGWQKVYLWKVGSDEEARELGGLKGQAIFLAFPPDGKTLVVGMADEILHLDLATGKRLHRFFSRFGGSGAVSFLPGRPFSRWQAAGLPGGGGKGGE